MAKQFSVWLENVPGTLAGLAGALAGKKVNLLALTASEREGRSLLRFLVDKIPVAKNVLEKAGYQFTIEEVLTVSVPNRPGMTAALASKLGQAGINIDYIYQGSESGSTKVVLVLGVSDLAKARNITK